MIIPIVGAQFTLSMRGFVEWFSYLIINNDRANVVDSQWKRVNKNRRNELFNWVSNNIVFYKGLCILINEFAHAIAFIFHGFVCRLAHDRSRKPIHLNRTCNYLLMHELN